MPGNSHLRFDALQAYKSLEESEGKARADDWFSMNTYTYVLLKKPDQQQALEQNLQALVSKTIQPWVQENKLQATVQLFAQPLRDIHLSNDFTYDIAPSGNRSYIYIFSFVALFLLVIASINYINLATARSIRRAKEVGLRKVIGANKWQLVRQFTGESLFITLIATLLALVAVELLLPAFNQLTDKAFFYTYFADARVLLVLAAIVVFVGLGAGSYPAFYLARFQPADVLKSNANPKGGSALLRKTLVVTQFTIYMVLIIATLVVLSQMHFLKNTHLGFTKEQVLVVDIPSGDTALVNRLPSVKAELLAYPGVTKIAACSNIPGTQVGRALFYSEHQGERTERAMNLIQVDYDFLDLMKIPLADGRNFSSEQPTDKAKFIVNEAAEKYIGWDKAVGQKLSLDSPEFTEVIGVVKDFHFASLHNKIEPITLVLNPKTNGFLLLRVEPQNLPATLDFIKTKWQAFDPKHPMEYFFLDQKFDEQYRSEEKMLTVFGYFAGLTIFIACLGLFGLAAFTAEQRTKEIGIRKVLGSSVSGIILLLSRDFALLVLIAILVASPIAWWGMQHWLEDFAYRTPIGWWIFAVAGISALVIAMLTVSYQATKAALRNPVKALRSE